MPVLAAERRKSPKSEKMKLVRNDEPQLGDDAGGVAAGRRKVIQQARHLPGGAVLKGQGGPLIAGPAAADVHLPLGQGQVRAHGGVVIRQGDQGHIHGIAEALIRGEHPVPDGLRKLHLYRHRQFQLYVKVLMLSDRHRQVLVRQQHTQFLCL